mmetsp:Transcript_59038/g.132185  ORF Transcript_59038/g.132185 Transcript_59038/m.132185 type:complete len:1135 (+) Transcript_59038:136-3540(+)
MAQACVVELAKYAPLGHAWAWRYIRAQELLSCSAGSVGETLKEVVAEERQRKHATHLDVTQGAQCNGMQLDADGAYHSEVSVRTTALPPRLAWAAPMSLVLARAARRSQKAVISTWHWQAKQAEGSLVEECGNRRTPEKYCAQIGERPGRSKVARRPRHDGRKARGDSQQRTVWQAALARQAFEGWVQVSERGHSRRALRLFCEGYHSQALLCKALVALQQFAEVRRGQRHWAQHYVRPLLRVWKQAASSWSNARSERASFLEQAVSARWLEKVGLALELWRALARRHLLRKRSEDLLQTLVRGSLLRKHHTAWRHVLKRNRNLRSEVQQRVQFRQDKTMQLSFETWHSCMVLWSQIGAVQLRHISSIAHSCFRAWQRFRRRMQQALAVQQTSAQLRRAAKLCAWNSGFSAAVFARASLARRILGWWREASCLRQKEACVVATHLSRLVQLAWAVWMLRLQAFDRACSFASGVRQKWAQQAFLRWRQVYRREKLCRRIGTARDLELMHISVTQWRARLDLWLPAKGCESLSADRHHQKLVARKVFIQWMVLIGMRQHATDCSRRRNLALLGIAIKGWMRWSIVLHRSQSMAALANSRRRRCHIFHWRQLVLANHQEQATLARVARGVLSCWIGECQRKRDWRQHCAALWDTWDQLVERRQKALAMCRWSAHQQTRKSRHQALAVNRRLLHHWSHWSSERRWHRLRQAVTIPRIHERALVSALTCWHRVASGRRGMMLLAARFAEKCRAAAQLRIFQLWRDHLQATEQDIRLDVLLQSAINTTPWASRAALTRTVTLQTAFAAWAWQTSDAHEVIADEDRCSAVDSTWMSEVLSTVLSLSPERLDHAGASSSWSFAEASTSVGCTSGGATKLNLVATEFRQRPRRQLKSVADESCRPCALARRWRKYVVLYIAIKACSAPCLQLALSVWRGLVLRGKVTTLKWLQICHSLPAIRAVQRHRLSRFFAAWLFGAGLARPWLLELMNAKALQGYTGLATKKPKRPRRLKVEFDEDLACFAAWSHAAERVMTGILNQPVVDVSMQVPMIPSPFEVELLLRVLRAWRRLSGCPAARRHQSGAQVDPICTARYVYKPSANYLMPQQQHQQQQQQQQQRPLKGLATPTVARSVQSYAWMGVF